MPDRAGEPASTSEQASVDSDRSTDPGPDRNAQTYAAFTSGTQTCLGDTHRLNVVDGRRRNTELALEGCPEVDPSPPWQQGGRSDDAAAAGVDPAARGDANCTRSCRARNALDNRSTKREGSLENDRPSGVRIGGDDFESSHQTSPIDETSGNLAPPDVDSDRQRSRHARCAFGAVAVSIRGVIAISKTRCHGSVGGSIA